MTSPKRGRQIVFGAGVAVLALVGFIAVRSVLPASDASENATAPDDSIEELLPPPPPPSSSANDGGDVVEMTFDLDAARGRPRSHGPRHRKPRP